MKKYFYLLPYLLINIIIFYILPLISRVTDSGMILLLDVIPVSCFITAMIFGFRNSFKIYYSFIIAMLFLPTIYIYYNDSATIYVFAYFFVALMGNLIGDLLGANKK